jgi:hypothetical protein
MSTDLRLMRFIIVELASLEGWRMKKLILVLFVVTLSFAFLIFPSISEARGGSGGHGGWGGYQGGYYGGHYGGHFRGYYGWGHYGGYYRGYYPPWYSSFYWGFPILGWPYVGWPYAFYGGSPYVGWPYYPSGMTEAPPADSEPAQPQPYYWYYCQDPQGYYPYVKSCPGGWIEVVPKAAPPSQ